MKRKLVKTIIPAVATISTMWVCFEAIMNAHIMFTSWISFVYAILLSAAVTVVVYETCLINVAWVMFIYGKLGEYSDEDA